MSKRASIAAAFRLRARGVLPLSRHPLANRDAFILGAVDDPGRAVAVALAEAGATVSVSTATADEQEKFVANSILNEAWSMGRAGAAFVADADNLDELQAAVELKDAPLLVSMPAVSEQTWPDELAAAAGTDLIAVRAVEPGSTFEIEARGSTRRASLQQLGAAVTEQAADLPRRPSPPPRTRQA